MMIRPVRTGLIATILFLAAMGTASAQLLVPPGVRGLAAYTGVTSPFGHQPALIPSDWYHPQVSMHYAWPPQVLYVPVAVGPSPRPAVEVIPSAQMTLGRGMPLGEVRVKAGTVVTWTNVEE